MADAPRLRWFHFTPSRLLIGLLAVQGVLLLCGWFEWFPKGYAVLITLAAVGVAMLLMLLWLTASLLFRWRFQFSIQSLLVFVAAVAILCSWLAVEMKKAEEQREVVEAVVDLGGFVVYHHMLDPSGIRRVNPQRPEPAWVRNLVGIDFLAEVVQVNLDSTEVTDSDLEQMKRLSQLASLNLFNTKVTDRGLAFLEELTRLERLELGGAVQITDTGVKRLRQALPSCQIYH